MAPSQSPALPDWVLDVQLAQQSPAFASGGASAPRVILVLNGAADGKQQPSERLLRSLLFCESFRNCLVIFQHVISPLPRPSRLSASSRKAKATEEQATLLSRERTVKATDVQKSRRSNQGREAPASSSSVSTSAAASGWHLPPSAAEYVKEHIASYSSISASPIPSGSSSPPLEQSPMPPRVQPTVYTCSVTCLPTAAETTKAFVEQAVVVAREWKKRQQQQRFAPARQGPARPTSFSSTSSYSSVSRPSSPSSETQQQSAASPRPENRREGSSWYRSTSGLGRCRGSDGEEGAVSAERIATPPLPQLQPKRVSSSWSLSSVSSTSSAQSRASHTSRSLETSKSTDVLDAVVNLLPSESTAAGGPQRFQTLLKDTLFTTTLVLPYLSRPSSAPQSLDDDDRALAIAHRPALVHVLPSDAPEPLPAVLESYLTSLNASPDVRVAAYAVASRVVDSAMPPAFDRIGRNAIEILLGGALTVTGPGKGRPGHGRPTGGNKAYLASWSACRFTSFPPSVERPPPAVVVAPSTPSPSASASSSVLSAKKDRHGSQGSVAMESVASSSTTSRLSWTASSDTELSGPPTPPGEALGSPPTVVKPELSFSTRDTLPRISEMSIVGPPKVVKSRQSWIGKLFS